MAITGMTVAGWTPQLRTNQRERQLAGEQLIERKPRPERSVRQNVGQFDGAVDAVQSFLDRRELAAADNLAADPFRQVWQLLQRLRNRSPQRSKREAFRQGIDRIDPG